MEKIGFRLVGEVDDAGAVGIHDVDLTVAVSGGCESNLRAVGRPVRMYIGRGPDVGEVHRVGPCSVHQEDREEQGFAVVSNL